MLNLPKPPSVLEQIRRNLVGKSEPTVATPSSQFVGANRNDIQLIKLPYPAAGKPALETMVQLAFPAEAITYPLFNGEQINPEVGFAFQPCNVALKGNFNFTNLLQRLKPDNIISFRTKVDQLWFTTTGLGNGGFVYLLATSGTDFQTSVPQRLRRCITLSNTPLAANGVFDTGWIDSETDGTQAVTVESLSNVGSAVGGLTVESTNDPLNVNGNATQILGNFSAVANAKGIVSAMLYRRYWRVIYTNGGTVQANFILNAVCWSSFPSVSEFNATIGLVASNVSLVGNSFVGADDNQTTYLTPNSAGIPLLVTAGLKWGGGFSGTPDAVRKGYSSPRMPTVFKQASTAATGSTALWTPASNNKFRLLGYRVQVTGLAKAAAAADLKINLLDGAADIGQANYVTVQTTALTLDGNAYDSGWVNLGEFGVLSAAANNVLNLNLSFALTGGLVNVNTQGVEE